MKKLLLLIIILMVAAPVYMQVRRPGDRLVPMGPSDYYIPRSVGVNMQIRDMSNGPIWTFSVGQPLWKSFDYMEELGITAVGIMTQAHPTINYWENINRAFRHPAIDVIVLRPEHWGSQDFKCVGDSQQLAGILWENYPMDLFDMLYQKYPGQDKDIIVINAESDWQSFGLACRERTQCIKFERYYKYYNACMDGTLASTSNEPSDCAIIACDMVKQDRAAYVLETMIERQQAAENARQRYPNAKLRVWHAIEVNFFGNKEWQIFTSLEDIVDVVKPDFVGLSMYQGADDVSDSLTYAMQTTGLPVWRFFISEVGTKEKWDGKQYDRITHVVDTLFERGVAFALVWSIETELSYDTGYSVIDRKTGEWNSGMYAIQELNGRWR